MSFITDASSGNSHPQQTRTRDTNETWKFSRAAAADPFETVPSEPEGDTVEISDAARQLQSAAANKPYSIIEYTTVFDPDSKEGQAFRDLLKSVKSRKSDITSQIEDALRKNGISLGDLGKVKIEVDGSGKIVAGGLDDKKALAAIEEALNGDKTLAGKIRQFHKDEKELSKQLREFTGCSLYELTMTARGDVNKRIQEAAEGQTKNLVRDEEYYTELRFLGANKDRVVSCEDIAAVSFNGRLDFSGEVDMLSNPEGNIRDSMRDMNTKIQDKFAELNKKFMEKMEASGTTLDAELLGRYFLDIKKVTISVDNHGAVTVEGMLAGDEATHRKGVEIIQQMAREMLNDSEANSYHLNPFTESSDILLARKADAAGSPGGLGGDARVVAEIAGGLVGEIGVTAPKMEKELLEGVQNSFNAALAESGVHLDAEVRLEVDASGKLAAANLPEGTPGREEALALLEKINAAADEEDPSAKGDEEDSGSGFVDAREAIESAGLLLARLRELRG